MAKLREAGAIVYGKTNLPIYAGDFQSYNDVFGTTNNPHDLTPHARWLVGRLGGRAGLRLHAVGARERHRRVHPAAGAHVGGDGAQAELRHRARPRADPRPTRDVDDGRPRRRRSDGPHGRRPRAGPLAAHRAQPVGQPGVASRAAAAAPPRPPGLPGRRVARRRAWRGGARDRGPARAGGGGARPGGRQGRHRGPARLHAGEGVRHLPRAARRGAGRRVLAAPARPRSRPSPTRPPSARPGGERPCVIATGSRSTSGGCSCGGAGRSSSSASTSCCCR